MGDGETGRRWWAGFRVLVIGLWVVASAVNWWTAPRQSTYEQARADIAGQRVVAFQWGDHWRSEDTSRWFDAGTLTSSGKLGPLFLWRTADGRVHWMNTEDFDGVTAGADDAYSGPGATSLAVDIRNAGAEQRNGDVTVFSGLIGGIGLVLGLTFLLVLLAGPQPVIGTKGYWFWIGVTMPYGLGLIFWTLRDRPWAVRRPATDPRRAGWLIGLGTGVLLGVLISVALHLLNQSLGDRWIPYGDIWP